ncbi:MAG TPA: hypothetical protein PKV33_07935 [Methanothrix sp.]|nr:hypothetical protein [Methanothrix sp.]
MVMKLRPIILLALILLLIAGSMTASGHRMFLGQSMTIGLSAIYDDGEPAAQASVLVFRNGVLYSENQTDSTGFFRLALPGRGTGDWRFVVSGDGHEEVVELSINDGSGPIVASAALAVAAVPVAWLWRWRGRNQR